MRGIALLIFALLGSAVAWPSLAPRLVERAAGAGKDPAASSGRRAADGWNRITVPAGPNRHFYLEAQVNGAPVTFMIDSGASAVVLSPEDARRVGLLPGQLRYSLRFETANGSVRAAPVTLRELRIGQLSIPWLEGVVIEAPLGVSLLGTSFLSRLEAWKVEGGQLHLYW